MKDLGAYTGRELGEIYAATIGHDPVKSGEMTADETRQVLREYAAECGPLVEPASWGVRSDRQSNGSQN